MTGLTVLQRIQSLHHHLDQAALDACVIVALVAEERGYREGLPYEAAEPELPWHELIATVNAAITRIEGLQRLRETMERERGGP